MQKKNDEVQEEELVRCAQKGDMTSLGILFMKHRSSLYSHAIYLLGYIPQAEDAVSDTFLIAMVKLQTLRKHENFKPWLHAILKNACRMYWRRTNRELPLTQNEEANIQTKHENESEEFIDKLFVRDIIWDEIDALSENLKTALLLRYFTNFYSYSEISQILQIPEGTVKSRLFEAKSKLRGALKKGIQGIPTSISQKYHDQAHYHKHMWEKFYRNLEGLDEYFASDVQTLFPKENVAKNGLRELEEEIKNDLKAGSILHTQSAITSKDLTIIEGKIINSPKTPFRCPPNTLAILFHPDHRVQRMYLYLS